MSLSKDPSGSHPDEVDDKPLYDMLLRIGVDEHTAKIVSLDKISAKKLETCNTPGRLNGECKRINGVVDELLAELDSSAVQELIRV